MRVGAGLLVAFVLLSTGAAAATGHAQVVRVSRCPGWNAEVVQAVDGRYM
jgi:hypothetical protein